MSFNHTFATKEVMVPFKCDVHGWMSAYVGVLDHPYFGTTAPDGRVVLGNLPPGTYTIEAWHETLGTRTQQVTIARKNRRMSASPSHADDRRPAHVEGALRAPATSSR